VWIEPRAIASGLQIELDAYMRRQTVTVNWSGELPLAQGIKFDL